MSKPSESHGEEKSARVARVHELLSQFSGDRKRTAEALEWDPKRLRNFIKDNTALRQCWQGSQSREGSLQTAIDALSRESNLPAGIGANDQAIAVSLAQEELKLKRGLESLRLSPREAEYAAALSAFDKEYFSDMVHMASSGAARISILIQGIFTDLHDRLQKVSKDIREYRGSTPPAPPPENGTPPVEAPSVYDDMRDRMVSEERSLVNQILETSEQVKRLSELFYKGALVRAAISGNKSVTTEKKLKTGFVNTPPADNGSGGKA